MLDIARSTLTSLIARLDRLGAEFRPLEPEQMAWNRADETGQRLEMKTSAGLTAASATSASISDPTVFTTGRRFAAFFGMGAKQNSLGGKERLGRRSKMADWRRLSALACGGQRDLVIRRVGSNIAATGEWVRDLLVRKPARLATVAMVNKTAHTAWA